MEAKTENKEGAEFMQDILSGDEKTLVSYIETVGAETASENIYKLARYADSLTDKSEALKAAEDEMRSLKKKYSMHDFYRDEYYKLDRQVKRLKAAVASLSAIVTEQ